MIRARSSAVSCGWRDLDREIGENLQKEGIPVVGVDALRYFWNERQPPSPE